MKMMRFGIIGCGMISSWHVKAIAANADKGAVLTGVTDSNINLSRKLGIETGARVFDHAEKLICDANIDVVCICTPSGLHAALATAAVLAGKHIVVEKPMSLTVADGKKLIAACDKTGVKSAIISQLRFTENVKAVKKAITEERLGKLVYGAADMKYYRSQEYYDRGSWRGTKEMDGGGALMNQGIHGVDLLQYLMGGVRSIFARAKTLIRKIEVEDTLTAVIEFGNGALGSITATTSVSPGFNRKTEICGEYGSIILDEDAIAVWNVKDYPLPEGLRLGQPVGNTSSDPSAFGERGHTLQIADLIDAVRENRPALTDCREGLKPVEIIAAAYESAEKRKEIILNGKDS
ncbi:oxidoreductase [Clostridia bacterium]|nr:oxidoreductase [Clostridia bacterium]